MKLAIVTGTAGGLAVIAFALLVSGCGGGGGGPSSPSGSVGPVAGRPGGGGPSSPSGAVGPVAGRPLVPMPSACQVPADAGVTCVEVASGESNVCEIDPAAGYYGCCCGTMIYGINESGWANPIPGGPADPCTIPDSPGETPHSNCIEVPVVARLSADPRYIAGTISAQLCGAGGSYSETNEQATGCCCYQ